MQPISRPVWDTLMKTRYVIVLLAVVGLGVTGPAAVPTRASAALPIGGVRDVARYLRPQLRYLDTGATLYDRGTCIDDGRSAEPEDDNVAPSFFRLRQPQPGATGMRAIRQMFAVDRNVYVARRGLGVVHVLIGDPSDALLNTRIRNVAFNQGDRYTPWAAISRVETTEQVQAAMQRMRLELPPFIILDALLPNVSLRAPHLPGIMKNFTLGDFLDTVARTFGGVFVYESCREPDGDGIFWIGSSSEPH